MKAWALWAWLAALGLAVMGMVVVAVAFVAGSDDVMQLGGMLTIPLTVVLGTAVAVAVVTAPAAGWQRWRRRRRG
ncbi:MAG: hypothetical protein HY856_13610 [Burkholderiales bacterium]|nr:hypothetical protein [Burkholderiales bacterium]